MTKPKLLAHNYTGNSLTIVYQDMGGRTVSKIADSSHANWKQLEKAYKSASFDKVISLIDVSNAINSSFKGMFEVRNGKVYKGNEEVTGYLFDKILLFMRTGQCFKRLLNFANNLWANPSESARQRLYAFLEHGNFPITKDGCFIAYKGVKNDFYSQTAGKLALKSGKTDVSGHIFNGVGEVIEVDRESVNPNDRETCSYGLHAGDFSYAKGFGPKLIIVKINPADVVSIPADENNRKLRTCKYKVLAGYEAGKETPLDDLEDADIEDVVVDYHNVRDSKGRFVTRA
jgi:hypothetical protein